MAIRECDKCGKSYTHDMFPRTNSKFFPSGRANLCVNCIEGLIDGENFESIDKACQWLNYPMLMDKWMQLYRTHRERTFRIYSEMFFNGEYTGGVDWSEMNEYLKQAIAEERLLDDMPELNQEWMKQMYEKWHMEGTPEDFKHLEYLYSDLMRTQNVVTGTQIDSALKMCKLSLLADKEIRKGNVPKDLIKSYQDLAKSSDFTPKNAKNVGDFDSCGELFLWLEKVGWRRKFYDFVERDEVDATISNLQAYTRRLVLGETSLTEDVEKRLDALQNFDINDTEDFVQVSDDDDLHAVDFLDEEEEEFSI